MKAKAMAFDAFKVRPVWPNETLAIMPRVKTPIPPTVYACKASDGCIQLNAVRALKKKPKIIQQ